MGQNLQIEVGLLEVWGGEEAAAQRPTMRFMAIKSEEQQASALVFRTRDLLVRQRTQLINTVRGHLTEYGWVAPKGSPYLAILGDLLDGEMGSSLPEAAIPMFRMILDMLEESQTLPVSLPDLRVTYQLRLQWIGKGPN